MLKYHVFGSLNLNNSEIFRLSFEDIFLGTLDTYTKKMNPPSAVLGGGVHGKVCWLIVYINVAVDKTNISAVRLNQMKLDVLFIICYTMYHYSVLSSVYISFRRQVDFTIT